MRNAYGSVLTLIFVGISLIGLVYFASTDLGITLISPVIKQAEILINVRGDLISYRLMKSFIRKYDEGVIFFSDDELAQIAKFTRQYSESEINPKLKEIESLSLALKQSQIEDKRRRDEEANARTVYEANGSPLKLVESRRCQKECTKDQTAAAKTFADACKAAGSTAFPGLCCDSVCSTPVAFLGELMSSARYVNQGELNQLQFSISINGVPRDPNNHFVVELEKVDDDNHVIKNFGRFYDNGQDGDLLANDNFETLQIKLTEKKLGLMKFRSRLQWPNGTWVTSQATSIEVQPKNTISQPRLNGSERKVIQHPKYGEVVANNILVSVRSGTPATQVQYFAKRAHCKIIQRLDFDSWVFEAENDTVEAMDQAMQRLKQVPEIVSVEPNNVGGLAD